MSFGEWYKTTCNTLQKTNEIKDIEAKFINQKTDQGRVSLLLKNKVFTIFDVDTSYESKNNTKSESYRTTGNKLYASNSLQDAMTAYSQSISLAERNTKAISLSYANRSAVLFSLKEFVLCKCDINLAFDNGYPVDLQYKLHERLGKCFYKLGDFKNACNELQSCLKSLNDSSLGREKRNDKAKVVLPLLKKCEGIESEVLCNTAENVMYSVTIPIIQEENKNIIYPCATASFSIKSDEEHGRYAVAEKDIHVGEVVIIEKPFTSICLPERFETHCYNCLNRFKVSYPCKNCATVNYCSIVCEKLSWSTFHQYECKYLGLLTRDDIGLGHLALKMVTQVGLDKLQQFHTRVQNLCGVNEEGVYDPHDYLCLYSLVGNSHLRKHSDLFRRSVVAIYLTRILQKTGFLKAESLSDATCINVAGHLLKQIQMLPCNAHEISEAQLVGSDLAQNELKEIGSAAYTTLSLLNHSCDPSVVRHCYGDVCVLRALKHIKKGEEIIDNYGFLYAVQECQERIQHLSEQYYFTCQCIACVEDWPLYNDLSNKSPLFKCGFCESFFSSQSKECEKCGSIDQEVAMYYSNDLQEKFEKAMEDVLSNGNTKENLPILLDYLDLVSRKAKLPFIHVNNCQEIIKLCFSLTANFARL